MIASDQRYRVQKVLWRLSSRKILGGLVLVFDLPDHEHRVGRQTRLLQNIWYIIVNDVVFYATI